MTYQFAPSFDHAVEYRPADGGTEARLVRHADLTPADHMRWAVLSVEAGCANVFAQDWFMDAAVRHDMEANEVVLAIVARADGAWLGVMPLIAERGFGRWPVRMWRGWTAANQFLGTPLVAPHAADRFWEALFGLLDRHSGGELLFEFRRFALDEPATRTLIDRCTREGRTLEIITRFDRPACVPGTDRPLDGDTRRRLNSLARRLERDHGPFAVALLDPAEPCEGWIDTFLAMETAGWKGRGGSSLGCSAASKALFHTVIAHGHAHGSARLATLSIGDRPLAMSSWFECGTRGYGFKMAFDEGYRSYAPGQLLMRAIVDRMAGERAMLFDTCMSPHQASNCHRLWPASRTIVDGAIAIGSPRRRLAFATVMKARASYAGLMRRLRSELA